MELSKRLKEYAVKVSGKEQLVMNMFAKALEIIPRTIADNAGLDSLDLINKLRSKHRNTTLMQIREENKAPSSESTSTKGLPTTRKLSCGNRCW